MLAKAFGLPSYLIWSPLTFLIRSYLLENNCSCPDSGSENFVKDGHNERKKMPDMQMLECNDCKRDFSLRAGTLFYWKLLQKIKKELQLGQKTVFFVCENRCSRVEFDRAVERGFKCSEK